MNVECITINGVLVWLTFDQMRVNSSDRKKIETKDEFLCYFKFSEPTNFILGELFRDNLNKPQLFNSISEAKAFAETELQRRLK